MASPSARPAAAHIASDSGLPGYGPPLFSLSSANRGSSAAAPGQHTARAGSITARSSALGMRRVSSPSTALPQPRRFSHARRASWCLASAAAHARGACDARRGSSVGARAKKLESASELLYVSDNRSARRSSTASGAERASSARAAMSSGTTASSSVGSSAAQRSATARSYAATRPGGYDEGGVGNGDDDAAAPAAAAPAAASSGSASLFAAARMIAGIRHPRVMYLRVAGDASRGPARRSAVAAISVSSSKRRRSGRRISTRAAAASGGAASASNTRKPRSAGASTVFSSGDACRGV